MAEEILKSGPGRARTGAFRRTSGRRFRRGPAPSPRCGSASVAPVTPATRPASWHTPVQRQAHPGPPASGYIANRAPVRSVIQIRGGRSLRHPGTSVKCRRGVQLSENQGLEGSAPLLRSGDMKQHQLSALSLQLSENARDAVLKGCPSYLHGHTWPDAF